MTEFLLSLSGVLTSEGGPDPLQQPHLPPSPRPAHHCLVVGAVCDVGVHLVIAVVVVVVVPVGGEKLSGVNIYLGGETKDNYIYTMPVVVVAVDVVGNVHYSIY